MRQKQELCGGARNRRSVVGRVVHFGTAGITIVVGSIPLDVTPVRRYPNDSFP